MLNKFKDQLNKENLLNKGLSSNNSNSIQSDLYLKAYDKQA